MAAQPTFLQRGIAALVLVLALGTGTPGLLAQEIETDATDLPAVLKSIAELEKLLTDGVSSNNARALRSLQEAAASPKATLDFYLEAKKAVDFDATGKTEADWRTWRDSNEESNKDAMNVAARQLQLRYLVLCLQATSGPPSERKETLLKVLPLLGVYLDDLAAKFSKLGDGQDIAAGSALDSVFANHLKLHLTMDPEGRVAGVSTDVASLYEQVILPFYRDAGDPQKLLAAWDKRIAHETAILRIPTAGGGANRFRRDDRDAERALDKETDRLEDEAKKKFEEVRLPQLQWQRERDGLLHGADKVSAYMKLTQILRAHLDHPAAQSWLDELKKLSEGDYKPQEDEEG